LEEIEMKNNVKFFVCEHCGNVVEKVEDHGVPVMCCGKKMAELVPGVVEASHEKHIPVAKVEGNLVKVAVGSVEHPMAEEHSILWVALESDKGLYRKHLEVGKAPEAVFALADEKPIAVYAYCNLHGLWKQEL
jgi:superoxide reductase